MAAELQTSETNTARLPMKRKLKHRKGKKPNKKLKPYEKAASKAKKPNMKMRKLFQKRAKEYDSDDDGEDEDADLDPGLGFSEAGVPLDRDGNSIGDSGEEEGRGDSVARDNYGGSDDESEGDGAQQGITRFAEGCRAFKLAFMKIMKKKLPNDPLGPILSAHKKLVAEKLAEDVAEHKVKAETKKEKHLAEEKGHVKPSSYLDVKEKLLISVATKGVVKLFNAVNKAQNPQKGLDPSKSKDAKVLAKRRKQTFLSELKKPTTEAVDNPSSFYTSKVLKSTSIEDDDEPGWAPLRDTYMLTNSKLKDWDKMPDPVLDDLDKVPSESSSDEE